MTYPSGQEQSSAVCSSIVGESDLDAIVGELVRVSSGNNHVSLEPGVRYLAADVLVGRPDNHTVLGSVVLVLVLDDQTFTGEVIGLAFATPPELNLEALEVSLVLHHFDKHLRKS